MLRAINQSINQSINEESSHSVNVQSRVQEIWLCFTGHKSATSNVKLNPINQSNIQAHSRPKAQEIWLCFSGHKSATSNVKSNPINQSNIQAHSQPKAQEIWLCFTGHKSATSNVKLYPINPSNIQAHSQPINQSINQSYGCIPKQRSHKFDVTLKLDKPPLVMLNCTQSMGMLYFVTSRLCAWCAESCKHPRIGRKMEEKLLIWCPV